jgi:hypothetical protein
MKPVSEIGSVGRSRSSPKWTGSPRVDVAGLIPRISDLALAIAAAMVTSYTGGQAESGPVLLRMIAGVPSLDRQADAAVDCKPEPMRAIRQRVQNLTREQVGLSKVLLPGRKLF